MTTSGNEERPLPEGWTSARIPDLVPSNGLFSDGDWVESKDQDPNGDVRLIQLADVGDGHYRDRSERFLTQNKALELKCTFLKKGDVLIARMPDPLGRACIFPGDEKESVTVVDVCIVRTTLGGTNHKWLMYWVNTPAIRADIEKYQSGTTRKRISRKNLAKIQFPVPPLPEQERIVAEIEKQFTRLDQAVASLKRAQAKLERYKASVLKAACEGRLVPQDPDDEPAEKLLERILANRYRHWENAELEKMRLRGDDMSQATAKGYRQPFPQEVSDLPILPKNWVWTNLDAVAYFIVDYRGKTPKSSQEGIPIISAANVKSGKIVAKKPRFISKETYRIRSVRGLPKPGDLILTTEAPVGDTALYPHDETYALTRRVIACQTNGILNEYLMYSFQGGETRRYLDLNSRGTTVPRILKPALSLVSAN